MSSTAQPGTTAVFKLAHRAAIQVQVHYESLGYAVERRFVILRDYACCTSLEFFLWYFERASIFNFDDVQPLEGALTNLLSIVLFRIVVWRRVWSVVFNKLSKPAREKTRKP